jgi:hypothetical protein
MGGTLFTFSHFKLACHILADPSYARLLENISLHNRGWCTFFWPNRRSFGLQSRIPFYFPGISSFGCFLSGRVRVGAVPFFVFAETGLATARRCLFVEQRVRSSNLPAHQPARDRLPNLEISYVQTSLFSREKKLSKQLCPILRPAASAGLLGLACRSVRLARAPRPLFLLHHGCHPGCLHRWQSSSTPKCHLLPPKRTVAGSHSALCDP